MNFHENDIVAWFTDNEYHVGYIANDIHLLIFLDVLTVCYNDNPIFSLRVAYINKTKLIKIGVSIT